MDYRPECCGENRAVAAPPEAAASGEETSMPEGTDTEQTLPDNSLTEMAENELGVDGILTNMCSTMKATE